MSAHKVLSQQLTICLVLGIVVVVQLLVATNPDATLPAVPELVGVALLSTILSFTFSFGRTLQLPGWSFQRREIAVLSLVWLTIVGVTGSRAVVSLLYTPGQVWTPCWSLPNTALKLECFFQASINQNYGFRTFFMLLTAAILGTLACVIARSVSQGWKLLLGAVVFGPLLVTVVGFFCLAFGIEQALPKSFLYNDFSSVRLTQIFSNPGWVWPYLAPGLAIVLWTTVAASTWAVRIFGGVISVVLILGALTTHQRGALLLCVAYVIVSGFYCLIRGLKKRIFPILTVGGILLAALGSGMYSLFSHPKLLQELSQSIGYDWKSKPLTIDLPRLQIWQAAWEIFKKAPLFGHGYASWFQMILEYGKRYNMQYVYDTAHNLFVQILVELGLVHTLLILSLLVFIALTVFHNSRRLPEGRLLFLLAVSSFFVPTLVQEINFIRPTFYIHAIFWGTLAGLPFHQNHVSQYSSFGPRTHVQQQNLFAGSAPFIPSLGFALLAGMSVLGILFCSLNFSFGGYSFDASLSQPNTSITRWLGPSVTLASFPTAENKAYSVFSTIPFERPMSVHTEGKAKGFGVTVDNDELFLALENGGQYWPRRHHLSFEPAIADNTRWISTLIVYPPVQSNLGISWSKNMYPWQNIAGRAGRWCKKNCVFLAKSCGRRDRLDFAVQSFRPDIPNTKPLAFKISVYGLAEGSEFSSELLKNLPKPIAQVQARLKTPGEEKLIHVDGVPDTAWYLVRLGTNSAFNPKSLGLSQDNRDLGVVIHEVDCRF
ncbi:MAG TPA: O-antigen ligase [Coleofasciculaceae cyanobacterium]|jgi:O-antigen ligase